MQGIVGGLIEYVPLQRKGEAHLAIKAVRGPDEDYIAAHVQDMVVNEEGLMVGLEFNPLATALAGLPIVGKAIVFCEVIDKTPISWKKWAMDISQSLDRTMRGL